MNRNRARIAVALLCLVIAGIVTLYNVGVFDARSQLASPPQSTQSAEGTNEPPAGVLPGKEPM